METNTRNELSLGETTTPIFTAEHGRFTHKTANLHHELTHVPLIIYWPGLLEGGSAVAKPVSLVDIFPTILDALGREYEREMINGTSLLKAPEPGRPVFAQRLWDGPPEPANSDFVVRGEAALFIDYEDGREELYLDYDDHPFNVVETNGELLAELKGILADRHAENLRLMEYYGTTSPGELEDRAQMEKLRALGYLQ